MPSSSNPFLFGDLSANNWNNDYYNSYMAGGSGPGSPTGSNGSPSDLSLLKPQTPAPPASIGSPNSILGNYAGAGGNNGGWGTILSGGPGNGSQFGSPSGSNGNSAWDSLLASMTGGGGYTGVPSANQGFDPWAGNPYAASMAQNMIGNMNQLPQMTADVTNQIASQMNQNANRNFQYEQARVQANLMQDKLANDKAAVDAQLAIAQGQQTFQGQQLAAQLKMASDQLAAQIEQNKQQMAYQNAQLAQQGQLGNKGLDVQAAQAAAQQAFQQQQLAQQGQLGNKQLDIQSQQVQNSGSAADQLAFQKWLAEQQMSQQNADRTQKNDLLAMIMAQMGGGGGGASGGTGGGTGSGGTGSGFTGPQGQYAINTGITAGALNPSAIRNSVSAIEGQPGGGVMAGPRGGMTGAQQQALSADMGAMNFAGGQAASNEALRQFLPQNARLDLAANNAKNGGELSYAQFLAEQERGAAGKQQNQNSLYLQLMNAI